MNWFNNLSIKHKISSIAWVGVIALLMSFAVNYILVDRVQKLLSRTIETQIPTMQFINEMQGSFAEIKELHQAAIMTVDDSVLYIADGTARHLLNRLHEVKAHTPYHQAELNILSDYLQMYTDAAFKQAERVIVSGEDIASPEMVEGFYKVDELREEYENKQQEFIDTWQESFKQDLVTIQEDENKILSRGGFIGLIAFAILTFFSALIIRQITRVLNKAVRVADKIAKGDLKQNIKGLTNDETGQLMSSLGVMRDALQAQKTETEQHEALQLSLSGLNETMRGDQNIDSLAANIIEYLAGVTESCIGAFYLLQGNQLSLLASYAYSLNGGGNKAFEVGESIVGQCALERKILIITDLPADYIRASSGTGEASPTSIIVFPIEQDGQLLGVIELGSFRVLGERALDFIEGGKDGIAISINSAQSRVRMTEVLQQTRSQAEELTLQQEQMEVINAELEERSNALDKQKNEILQKNNELERSKKGLLEKSHALEASDRYKTQFLSTMSHELRTPLNSILILSQALMDNKKGHLSDKEVKHAHVINSSGGDLLTLINDILDLSKIEEGKLDLVFEDTPLTIFAKDLTDRFEFVAGNKNLEFKVNIEEGMPKSVVTDTHRLNQVLKNFISNSIKFTEQGGIYIDIHRPRAPFVPVLSGLNKNDAYVIAVRDTGIGIPKEKQDVIFEAFKQADGTTSRKYGGTGLGLTISRELAVLLGGEISVHSDGEGKGSIFYMVLPFDSSQHANESEMLAIKSLGVTPVETSNSAVEKIQAASSSSKADADKAAILALYEQDSSVESEENEASSLGNSQFARAQKTDRILIVEDDEKFAQILNELILEAGLFCDLVHSGEDGLTYLAHYHPQAVILDISLPDISGWEVLKQIKACSKAQSIPVHIVSAMPEKKQATQRGAIDFTEKPVSQGDVQGLLATIKDEIGESFDSVLLVEDNIALHEAIVEQFGDKGIRLGVAATGEEGLQKAQQQHFDCLIVDLMLPDMDGVDLLKQLRQIPEYIDTPMIVFTAEDMSAEREFEISKYSDRVIIKSGQAMDRLVHTVSLFLGKVSRTGEQEAVSLDQLAQALKAEKEPEGQKSEEAPEEELPAESDIEYAEYEEGDLEGCKVLLVDDDIRNIYSLSAVLEMNGMEVQTAMGGLEALDKLEKEPGFEVVLMDIMMPEMDGYETMRRIRAGGKYAEVPIIALTAKAMKEDRALCIKAGASDYLAKPVDAHKLSQLLVAWTKRAGVKV